MASFFRQSLQFIVKIIWILRSHQVIKLIQNFHNFNLKVDRVSILRIDSRLYKQKKIRSWFMIRIYINQKFITKSNLIFIKP